MTVVQVRRDTNGRAYYGGRLAEGKTPMEAMRALNRGESNTPLLRRGSLAWTDLVHASG